MIAWRLVLISRRQFATRVGIGTVAGLLGAPTPANAQSVPAKPRLLPGRDPGGIAVALIGAGVDYTRAEIAGRLARDGEGEAIAWDLLDNDPRPFERPPPASATQLPQAGTEAALILLAAAPTGRLIPVRVGDPNVQRLAQATAFVAQTPARIVVLLSGVGPGEAWDRAARVFEAARNQLYIVPAQVALHGASADAVPSLSLGNLVVVTAADAAGNALAGTVNDPRRIDVAVSVNGSAGDASRLPDAVVRWEALAAIGLAARAVAVLTAEPKLDGAGLKARLLSVASHGPPGAAPFTRSGVLLMPQ